jgi:AraC-like DNA-binding protein
MNDIVLNLSIIELIAFLGLFQTTYILVYIALRSKNVSIALIPLFLFFGLGSGFFVILLQKFWFVSELNYTMINWFVWAICAPLSSLLVIQISQLTKAPELKYFNILLIVPIAFGISILISNIKEIDLIQILPISAIFVGSVSLLFIWLQRKNLDKLHKRKNGKERFWLIISLIILNIALISANLFSVSESALNLFRAVTGLGFLYIVSTSIFRVYPPVIQNKSAKSGKNYLSAEEIELALEVENLLHVQKVYQEQSYNRATMAKELNVTETALSKVVNQYFQKTVPLLLNELRVKEAKILLRQTNEDIRIIAEEAGFNSIATFNRVFKGLEGVSPRQYRS